MNKKPGLFLWENAPTAIVAFVATATALLLSITTQLEASVLVLFWVISCLIWLMWVVQLWHRSMFLDKIKFTTKHNMCIFSEDGYIFTQSEIEELTEKTITNWQLVIDGKTPFPTSPPNINRFFDKFTYVTFKQGPIIRGSAKFAGRAVGRRVEVGVLTKGTLLDKTAFDHEIGHIIYTEWKSKPDSNDEEHVFAKENNLR